MSGRRVPGRLARSLLLLVALACSSACTGEPEQAPDLAPDAATYVAMGDSFVAGPGMDPPDKASGICLRSAANWPALVASDLEVEVSDVSCSGATTAHLTEDVPLEGSDVVPAQIDALSSATDLVTLTIGGNDDLVLGELIAACAKEGDRDSGACRDYVRTTMPPRLDRMESSVIDVLDRIRDRAPGAAVVLVGYLRMGPTSEGCAAFPLSEDDVELFADGERAIDRALDDAATESAVTYISGWELGTGQDPCAPEPWVNGLTAEPGQGEVLHPRPEGMRAVADAVAANLRG